MTALLTWTSAPFSLSLPGKTLKHQRGGRERGAKKPGANPFPSSDLSAPSQTWAPREEHNTQLEGRFLFDSGGPAIFIPENETDVRALRSIWSVVKEQGGEMELSRLLAAVGRKESFSSGTLQVHFA